MESSAILSLLLLVACPALAFRMSLQAGQQCQMRSGETGLCRLASECPSAATSLQTGGVWPVTCGFQGRQPVICCSAREGNSLTHPTTATAAISRKSEQACETYNKLLFPGVRTNIIDGDLVVQGEMPHMAALGFAAPNSQTITWDCGGSLISDRYVLTAAHCFKRKNWRLVKVRLGAVQLNSTSEGAVEETVAEVKIHQDYRAPYNDIALVRLNRAVPFSDTLAPACLYNQPHLPGDALIVAGWGATDPLGDKKSNFLLKAVVRDVGRSQCNVLHKANPSLRNGVVESMVCAYDPQGNKDTCSGDSGGPLQALTERFSSVYSIIGVTSIGPKVCGSSIPAIYSKVSSYIPWIESIVWP